MNKINENMVTVLNQSVNPTAEDKMQQTSAGASPVIDNREPINWPLTHSEAIAPPTIKGSEERSAIANTGKTKKQSKAVKREFKPVYSDDKKMELEHITKVAKQTIQITLDNQDIPTIPFGEHNCLINLTEAYKNGINLLTPTINRQHGKDQERTGESIRTYGAQRHLLVITKAVADAAGIKAERFPSDKCNEELKDIDFVVIDGNGRTGYVLGLEVENMPTLWASFIEPDALGYYNPSKIMEVINTEQTIWKTPEHLQKRLLEEGQEAHEGWSLVQQLVKKGYMYQAACMSYTLDTDRIKVRKVNGGNANEVFIHIESAKKIHAALVERFGEGDDKTLKTKEFTKEVSILWRKLRDRKGESWATDTFVEFIEQFKDFKVQEILNAKTVKGEMNKDETRKKILNEQFNQFVGRKGIELD